MVRMTEEERARAVGMIQAGTHLRQPDADRSVVPLDVTRFVTIDTTAHLENSIGEPVLSQTVLEDQCEVVYEVIEEGSTRKRRKLVSSDGYSYCKKTETKCSVQWRCSVKRKGDICYANVTQHGDTFKRGKAVHTHPADPLVLKKVVLKRDIRQEAIRDVYAPAGRFVESQMVSTFTCNDFNIPRPSTLIRQMNRARQKLRPVEPTSLDFEVNTEFLKDEFLVGDVRVGDGRHLLFATSDQLTLLQRSRKWYLDGTFRVVNKPFTQLWSVHAFIRQGDVMKQVPLLFVLMSRRRKQDYVAVLGKIIEIMDEAPVVESFSMDFEVGLWQALRELFPGTTLRGCGFHWAQAVLRKVQEVGLQTTYQRREGAHQLIRKLLALPFLPGPHIRRAFNKLRELASGSSVQMSDLFTYVNDQWIDSSLWSTEEWSVYRQPVRTNNDTEGWHRRLNFKAGRGSLQLYVLLSLLLQEAKLVTLQLQLVSEETEGRHRRGVYRHMSTQVDDLWERYDAHEILCEDFLKEISALYNV